MTTEERMAAYDAMRAQQVANVQSTRGEHHDEATDALVVEALDHALLVIHAIHTTAPWHPPVGCEQCDTLGKIHRALRALGK